ncbi:phosphoribosylanthranilate isomerase [Bacillus sp. CLL-7-23]|uniref:N-(5'-phosphoribosyl)anthranilate isomerase n=1 Tax=Bacillus changyiensis TaxID=3004103 RepID=A0ABT4X031_9BACI|nr:phosphoribosylanthranilate isomerase [Bacillus changyiensis]MDA7025638.1 phosphoribosylanthranilate isomerase [Bacillus changyiensis]
MIRPSLKYCGIHSLHDLKVTACSLADYLGFIFAESKRSVHPLDVNRWCKQVDLVDKKIVGVFVNESTATIVETVKTVPLDVIQLHGDETIEDIKQLSVMTDCEIWKAVPHESGTIHTMNNLISTVDGFIIDSSVYGVRGGSGIAFSWEHVPFYKETAAKEGKRLFIAGGVHPQNVTNLLKWQPPGIDLASGIEEKGQKSERLIGLFEERVFM